MFNSKGTKVQLQGLILGIFVTCHADDVHWVYLRRFRMFWMIADVSIRRSGWQGQDIFRTAIPDSLSWFCQIVRSWLSWPDVFSLEFHQETTGCLACAKHLVERRSPDLGHRGLIPLYNSNLRGQHLGSSQFFSFSNTCWILECSNTHFKQSKLHLWGSCKKRQKHWLRRQACQIQTSSNCFSSFSLQVRQTFSCFYIHAMPFLCVLYILHALIKARFLFSFWGLTQR